MALKAVSAPLGSPVGGSGTPGTIPVWGSGTTLTDSQLIQSATAIYTTTRNFGVGTSNPATAKLVTVGTGATLTGTASQTGAFIQDQTNYRGVGIGFDTSGQIGILAALTGAAASNLAFWTYSGSAWGERARIDSSGRLIVGSATSPNASSVQIATAGAGGRYVATYNTTTSTGALVGTSTTAAYAFEIYTGSGTWGSETYRAEARIDTTNKYLDISGLTANSINGLKLPATPGNADANTLDAYNELGSGTYKAVTATLTCGTSGTITLKSANQSLYVTRVGRTVIVSGFLQVDSVASPVGRLTVTTSPALPSCQDGASANIVFTGATGLVAGDLILPTISASTIFCDLFNAGVQSQTAAANIQANTSLWVAFMYHAA